jgi:hypothetical protein
MPNAQITEAGITATAQVEVKKTLKRRRRERVSTAELYAALEGLLEPAQIEIDCLADYVRDFPDDEDHTQDAERVRQGQTAIELAKRLIARKTSTIRRQQRALEQRQGQDDA